MNIYTKFNLILLVFAALAVSCTGVSSKKKENPVIIFGRVDISGDSALTIFKFDAAMSLSAKLTGKFDYISLKEVQELTKNRVELKINELAEETGAEFILTAKVNNLKNIIRTNLTFINTENSAALSGTGYSDIHYINAETGSLVYDPSLLTSVQRAFAAAFKDSLMFVDSQKGINVKPLPTMVIGSAAFTGDNDWVLWEDKVINSYSAVETMYEAAIKSGSYVVYDTETRDSVYNIFGYHIVENYSPPNIHEINTLYKLEVDYYLAAELVKTEKEAEITISLYQIERNGLKLIKSEKTSFIEDDKAVFLKKISIAANKIIGSEIK